jgi:tryptophanyl-tRNA synthetase
VPVGREASWADASPDPELVALADPARLTDPVHGRPRCGRLSRRVLRVGALCSKEPFVTTLTASQEVAVARSGQLEHELAERAADFRVLTGDRPTGSLHIGHYVGSLRNRVRLQSVGVDVIVLIADYQVLTDRAAGQPLGDVVRGLVADYLAVGLDPDRTTIFTHSAVPELNELILPFLSLISDAELHRNPTVKSETELSGRPPSGLMLTYPVHQAADILFCKANLVPVGLDQLPHVETTRVVARRFNERYGRVFPEPDALLSRTPLLPGLDGQKMSKSRHNGIALSATDDETARLVRRAPTDSIRTITYDPLTRPAVASLLDMLGAITGDEPRRLAERIGPAGAAALKAQLVDALNAELGPVRARRSALAAAPEFLDEVLRRGNERAREVAIATLAEVHDALGLSYANHGSA